MKPTKYYIAFKYGNVNPFNLHWGGTHAWKIHVRVSREDAENVRLKNWELQRYDEGWNQAVFRRTNENAKASDLEELLKRVYESIRGKR